MPELESHHVTLRDKSDGHRWSLHFSASSFAHAEEQALDATRETPDQYEIIMIEKDYASPVRIVVRHK